MLAQGKDGAQGETGPQGSAANVPAWVKAYTDSAQFDTLVTDEWVISMNLFGSMIFGTEIYGGSFFDSGGIGKLNLSNQGANFADLVFQNAQDGRELFKVKDQIGAATLYLHGIPIIEVSTMTGVNAYLSDEVTVHAKFA